MGPEARADDKEAEEEILADFCLEDEETAGTSHHVTDKRPTDERERGPPVGTSFGMTNMP